MKIKKLFLTISLLLLLATVRANAAEEISAAAFVEELSTQFHTLRKELLEELGGNFPNTSEAVEKRMAEIQKEASAEAGVSSDDVQTLRSIEASLYSSYSTYGVARKDAERRAGTARRGTVSGDMRSSDVPIEDQPNMGLKQAPPYSIEAYDNASRSLADRRKRLSFDLFSLRASEKAARQGLADMRSKKAKIAEMSKKELSAEERFDLLIANAELELARVNSALQMSSISGGISTLKTQVASITTRAKQLEWMKKNLSFTEEQEKKITERCTAEFEAAQKALQTARDKNNAAERDFMRERNRVASSDVMQLVNNEIYAQYYYTRYLLTYADDAMNYASEALDIWKTRYKLFNKQIPGQEIWALRDKATKRIEELENKLEYLVQAQRDVSSRERETLSRIQDAKDPKLRKSLTAQAAIYRSLITEVFERYSSAIPNHIFLYQRLRDEAGQSLDTIRLAEKAAATGKDIFFSIMNTKLWEGDGYNFTVEKLLLALVALLFGFYGSRFMSRLIQKTFMFRLSKNTAAAVAVQRLLGYFIFFIFILLALQFVNIPLTAFAFMGGALALGFGFGAQNFFNNIISGFILMFSSPFKVGDIVDIDGTVGTIMEIGERATLLRTFTNLEMAVPNSYLLQNKVTNWTSSDQTKRETLQVGVSYRADPKCVREILNETLARHKEIVRKPEPYVIFKDFGPNSLVFELYYWVDLKNSNSLKIGSDLRYMIVSEFGKQGIEIPFPQIDVHFDKDKEMKNPA